MPSVNTSLECIYMLTFKTWDFPGGSADKESACNEGDLGSTPGLGRPPPPEKGMAAHSSILAWRIPVGREDWWATVHGVSKSWT